MGPDELQQAFEQGEAGAKNMAKFYVFFFKALIQEGMTRAEALEITRVWIRAIFSNRSA